jgi:hypothetical protein
MYDLKKVIEEFTVDGVVDYDKVMAKLDNDYVNPIVAKKTDESKLLPKAIAQVVSELGVEGESIDDLKLYVKKMGGSTDEFKEANIKLEKQLKELENKYNIEVETRTTLENASKLEKEYAAIKQLGVQDEDQLEFLHFKFNKAVTEEKPYEQVVAEYAKENKLKTTTKFIKNEFGGNTENGIDISEAFNKLNRRK